MPRRFGIAAVLCLSSALMDQTTAQGVGDTPGAGPYCRAESVSTDGSVLEVYTLDPMCNENVSRWVETEGGSALGATHRRIVRGGSVAKLGEAGDAGATASAAQLVYSNTIDPITRWFHPGNAAAGFWVADDISTIAEGGFNLGSYEITTGATAGSGAYDVTIELWDGNPCQLTSHPIGGTAIMIPGVPDGILNTLSVDFPARPVIPQDLFMKVTFSTDAAGWMIAETAESGFSDNSFSANLDTTGNGVPDRCGLFAFGQPPAASQASFWARIFGGTRCVSHTDCDDGDPFTVNRCIGEFCHPAVACADLDPNGTMNLRDFAVFQTQFRGQDASVCPEVWSADLDGNGTVDLSDFTAFEEQLSGQGACRCPPGACQPRCGDGCCNGNENACSCPQDGCQVTCGDGCCNGSENACTCPQDGCQATCGDGCCNGSENACSCPQDACGPICGDGCCSAEERGCWYNGGCPEDCGCGYGCDCCWIGTSFQSNCPTSWEGDADCDCGCQFSDPVCP